MKDWRSQSHVKWDCMYHVVIVPKYRRKRFYGRARSRVGEILRQLCRQKDVELLEGKAMADHIHMLLSVPPRYSMAMMIGYLKGPAWACRVIGYGWPGLAGFDRRPRRRPLPVVRGGLWCSLSTIMFRNAICRQSWPHAESGFSDPVEEG